MRRLPAFTLVELLVVVAIIIALLAMLMPALDRAVYEAELAVCGSNQHGAAIGAVGYAAESRRAYPVRPFHEYVRRSGGYNRPDLLRVGATLDDRPIIRAHIPLKLLRDPMVLSIDLDTDRQTQIHASIALWYGVSFRQTVGSTLYPGINSPASPSGTMGKGMFRIGDRLEWAGEFFDVLVSDLDTPLPTYPYVVASHPDYEGVMFAEAMESTLTLSRWASDKTAQRSPIDSNYTFQDGSVKRYDNVKWNDWELEERMADVPMSDQDEANYPTSYQHLPRR